MANGFGLYDMFGNVGEWLWDSYYSETTATTEYMDDNYKGPDLGLGDQRYYVNQFRSASGWDSQNRMSPTAVLGTKLYWSGTYLHNEGNTYVGQSPAGTAGSVGFRTVRGL